MKRPAGRPRDASLDDQILIATEELLLEGGFASLSIDSIAQRAGTSRPAFYRRYSGIPPLLLAMLLKKFGEPPRVDTGNLRGDLLGVQVEQVRLFAHPLVRRCLAGFLDSLLADTDLEEAFYEGFFRPRRAATISVIDRAVARGEMSQPTDPEWVCDLLSGPIAMRTLFPRLGPIDEALAQSTTATAVRELQAATATPR